MEIDPNKLEKAKHKDGKIIARCPACAEAGGDRKGEHLVIYDDGHFGCALYTGKEGHSHRQRIFELAGMREKPSKGFEIRKPLNSSAGKFGVIQKDILGRLGRINFTHARMSVNIPIKNNDDKNKDLYKTVPSVPDPSTEK